jgi:hypothetical protein
VDERFLPVSGEKSQEYLKFIEYLEFIKFIEFMRMAVIIIFSGTKQLLIAVNFG